MIDDEEFEMPELPLEASTSIDMNNELCEHEYLGDSSDDYSTQQDDSGTNSKY